MASFAYLNRVQIIGNLTRDPDIKTTKSSVALANFSVATNRGYKDGNGEWQEEVEYHDCVAFAKLAEIAEKILQKGQKVYVEGRLQKRKWENKEGQEKICVEIVVENFIVLSAKKSEENNNQY